VRWALATAQPLPEAAVAVVVDALAARWPDGIVRVERQAHVGHTTVVPTAVPAVVPAAAGSPSPRAPTSTFPLLEATSVVGEPSEALTRQWSTVRADLVRLARATTPTR
jgi:hypothetical protein